MASIATLPLPALDVRQRYTTVEAAKYLRISHGYLYELIASGEIRVIKDGRRTFVPGGEIARRSTLRRAA